MPNWCMNSITVSHENPEMIQKFAAAMKDENLFNTFVPNPTGQWDYGWSIDNWGTKWDVGSTDFTIDTDNTSGYGSFDTAWGPPIEFYRKLEELGFDVDATYFEPGMCFAGHYFEGNDNYYEYDFSDPDWADPIEDNDVVELLQSEYEAWLEWQEDEEDYDDDTDEEPSEESGKDS